MDQQVINLLTKYLNNRCTAEELKQIHKILKEGRYKEEWAAVLKETSSIDETPALTLDSHRAELLLKRIKRSTGISKKTVDKSHRKWTAVAASMLILLACGLGIFLYISNTGNVLAVVSTQAGQQQALTLSDGTTIRLGNASTLRYPKEFDGKTREVYLTGKAYFKVTHNASKPFIVHTEHFTVRDLGTAFGIRSYQNDKSSVVLVAEGKVRVSSGKDNKKKTVGVLVPGKELTFNRHSDKFTKKDIGLEDVKAWTKGKLIFYDQPLGDILRAIERRYEIKIRLEKKSMKDKLITFKQSSKSLKNALQVLSLISGLKYEIHNHVVIMK